MYTAEYECLVQIEAEELSETLLGASYFDLTAEWKVWVRARVIATLWPAEAQEGPVVAA